MNQHHSAGLVFPAFLGEEPHCPNSQATLLGVSWQDPQPLAGSAGGEDACARDWREPELLDAPPNPTAKPFSQPARPDPGNPASRPSARKTEMGGLQSGN